jgi:hypothetical protein
MLKSGNYHSNKMHSFSLAFVSTSRKKTTKKKKKKKKKRKVEGDY